MTITYTDDVKTVTDGLQTLINAEFKPIPLRIAKEFEERYVGQKGEYIRLWCTNIEQVSRVASGVYRDYVFDLVWYFNTQIYRTEKLLDDHVTPQIERLERLLDNNHTYGTGGTWFAMNIETDHDYDEDIAVTTEEEVKNVYMVRLILTISRGSFF